MAIGVCCPAHGPVGTQSPLRRDHVEVIANFGLAVVGRLDSAAGPVREVENDETGVYVKRRADHLPHVCPRLRRTGPSIRLGDAWLWLTLDRRQRESHLTHRSTLVRTNELRYRGIPGAVLEGNKARPLSIAPGVFCSQTGRSYRRLADLARSVFSHRIRPSLDLSLGAHPTI